MVVGTSNSGEAVVNNKSVSKVVGRKGEQRGPTQAAAEIEHTVVVGS